LKGSRFLEHSHLGCGAGGHPVRSPRRHGLAAASLPDRDSQAGRPRAAQAGPLLASPRGPYKDFIGVRGGNVRYIYKVCEAGTANCSNEVTVRFGGPPL
jgi:hypothetical protein